MTGFARLKRKLRESHWLFIFSHTLYNVPSTSEGFQISTTEVRHGLAILRWAAPLFPCFARDLHDRDESALHDHGSHALSSPLDGTPSTGTSLDRFPFLSFLVVARHRHEHEGMGCNSPKAPCEGRVNRWSSQPSSKGASAHHLSRGLGLSPGGEKPRNPCQAWGTLSEWLDWDACLYASPSCWTRHPSELVFLSLRMARAHHVARHDPLDPSPCGSRYQRYWALVYAWACETEDPLPELERWWHHPSRIRRWWHEGLQQCPPKRQHARVRTVDRRWGAPWESPCVPDLGKILEKVVRSRCRMGGDPPPPCIRTRHDSKTLIIKHGRTTRGTSVPHLLF